MAILGLSLNAHGKGAGRMHIFDNNTSINRDAVVNQLCAVVVPILFICVGLLFIWGERLANQLLRKDTYDQKRIQIRAYGIVRTSITALLMIFAVVYFLCYGIWDMAIIFAFALLGYAWIKVSTYCVRLDYTYRHIRIRSHRTSLQIPFTDITKMCWETHRGQIAYTLVIYLRSGAKIQLSSADFIGLAKLKSIYDLGMCK